jgi:enoyl-CoA hydratase/carnithine racemase
MTDSRISLEIKESIALLALNRPEKLNAIDPQMLADLDTALQQLEGDQNIRVIVMTGAGERAFCVGADIHAWAALAPVDMWRVWIREGHRIFDRLAQLRQPVIAALNGYTFGGGLELALTADIRLAVDTIEMGLPEVTLGTIPGWGGTQRLPALIGSGRARQMIFTGDRID